jgi:hypothetical protein
MRARGGAEISARQTLIAVKRAASRRKDFEAIAELEFIRNERRGKWSSDLMRPLGLDTLPAETADRQHAAESEMTQV